MKGGREGGTGKRNEWQKDLLNFIKIEIFCSFINKVKSWFWKKQPFLKHRFHDRFIHTPLKLYGRLSETITVGK